MAVEFPEWLDYPARILGTSRWFVGRKNMKLEHRDYDLCITGERYNEMRHQHRADCLALWADLDPVQRIAVALAFGSTGHDPNPRYNMKAAAEIAAAGFTVTREV